MNYFYAIELLDTLVSDAINNDHISFEEYKALTLLIDKLKGEEGF
jgi:hypothetical protein